MLFDDRVKGYLLLCALKSGEQWNNEKGFKCMKWAHITRYHRIYRKCFAHSFLTASRRGQEQTRVSTAFHRVVRVRLVVMMLVIVNIFTVLLCKYIDIWHLFVFVYKYMKNVVFVFLLGVFANQATGQANGKSREDNLSRTLLHNLFS